MSQQDERGYGWVIRLEPATYESLGFDNVPAEQNAGVDIETTTSNYDDLLESRISEMYPGAAIEWLSTYDLRTGRHEAVYPGGDYPDGQEWDESFDERAMQEDIYHARVHLLNNAHLWAVETSTHA